MLNSGILFLKCYQQHFRILKNIIDCGTENITAAGSAQQFMYWLVKHDRGRWTCQSISVDTWNYSQYIHLLLKWDTENTMSSICCTGSDKIKTLRTQCPQYVSHVQIRWQHWEQSALNILHMFRLNDNTENKMPSICCTGSD